MMLLRPLLATPLLLASRLLFAQTADHALCDRLATPSSREQFRPQAERLIAAGGAAADFVRGCLAWDDARPDAAIEHFERAAASPGAPSDFHLWLGNAYGVKAQRANPLSQARLARKTKGAFDRAVQLDGDNIQARDGLMQYYMLAPSIVGGSMQKAEEQAREIKRRNAYAGGLALATLAGRRKDAAAAERELAALHRTFPDSIGALSALLNLHTQQKQWAEGWAVLDAAGRGRLATHPRLLFLVGRMAALSGQQLDRGEAALTAYVARSPGRGEPRLTSAQLRLAQLHEKQGKTEQARAAYRAAIALDGKNDEARKGLKALEARQGS
jgi:predicted Zn-dependent protease